MKKSMLALVAVGALPVFSVGCGVKPELISEKQNAPAPVVEEKSEAPAPAPATVEQAKAIEEATPAAALASDGDRFAPTKGEWISCNVTDNGSERVTFRNYSDQERISILTEQFTSNDCSGERTEYEVIGGKPSLVKLDDNGSYIFKVDGSGITAYARVYGILPEGFFTALGIMPWNYVTSPAIILVTEFVGSVEGLENVKGKFLYQVKKEVRQRRVG